MTEKNGRCHDCTAPQTEVNILSRHILELQADKGELTDKVKELEKENTELKEALKGKRCNCITYFNFKDLENNLIKSKEIIRAYKNICNNAPFLTEEEVELKVKAEQFLKECK